jgi:ferric-dicitrate binding protein FerR (iron transport regulator)
VGRAAPKAVRQAKAAAADPRVKGHFAEGRNALLSARDRLRGSNDLAGAVTDEKLWSELRRAAAAMAAGYAAAQAPKPKRRRRLRRLALTVGVVGAGAYAGYKATRGAST